MRLLQRYMATDTHGTASGPTAQPSNLERIPAGRWESRPTLPAPLFYSALGSDYVHGLFGSRRWLMGR